MTIRIASSRLVYEGWLTLRVASLADGDDAAFSREIEDHGRAVAVLPYDPGRRVALLVTMPRAPVLFRGEPDPLLEAPAGLLEDHEDPPSGARREAQEEAGVELRDLQFVGRAWTMPGLSTETMDLFLARYTAVDRIGPGGGLAEEHEHITVVEMALRDLAALADRQALADLKTFALLQTLRLREPGLFG